jgi:hypothetical protein
VVSPSCGVQEAGSVASQHAPNVRSPAMTREQEAIDAIDALIGDDTVIEVGLAFPKGQTMAMTSAMLGGAAIGGVAGGSSFIGVGEAAGFFGARAAIGGSGGAEPASVVLALTDTSLYTFARSHHGPFGGWSSMKPMVRFDLATLAVQHHRSGVLLDITLSDTVHGFTIELESKLLGNLGIDDLLDRLDRRSGGGS